MNRRVSLPATAVLTDSLEDIPKRTFHSLKGVSKGSLDAMWNELSAEVQVLTPTLLVEGALKNGLIEVEREMRQRGYPL